MIRVFLLRSTGIELDPEPGSVYLTRSVALVPVVVLSGSPIYLPYATG